MSEPEALTSSTPTEATAPKNAGVTAEAFSFGDPIPVLDRRELLDYVECVQMDRSHEPPVSFDGLARTNLPDWHHISPTTGKPSITTHTHLTTTLDTKRDHTPFFP
ncbi:capsid portal protein, partial [Escherichia coli]